MISLGSPKQFKFFVQHLAPCVSVSNSDKRFFTGFRDQRGKMLSQRAMARLLNFTFQFADLV